MNVGEAVAERILELCRERNISVNRLCTLSGVTQSTVNNIVRLRKAAGLSVRDLQNNIVSLRNNSATVATVKKLCDGLDIGISEFFASPLFEGLEQEIK